MTPRNSLLPFEICTPIGTEQVHIEGDEIVGRLQNPHDLFSSPRPGMLVAEFVNWGNSAEDVVRFTRRYAPISWPKPPTQHVAPIPGEEFSFPLEEWLRQQEWFRRFWETLAQSSAESPEIGQLSGGAGITVYGKQVALTTRRLEDFMLLELLLTPRDRLRKCGPPGCENPYFVAEHRRQQYCSPQCAAWAQAKWKKQWWDQKGEDWLKDHKEQRKKRSTKAKSRSRKRERTR